MKRVWLCGLAFVISACTPPLAPAAKADPNIPQWKTSNSMGCMMVRACKDETKLINSWKDLGSKYSEYAYELNRIFSSFDKVGIKSYIAGDKYFTPKTRGLYNVKGNNLFISEDIIDNPEMVMGVIRHEGWHAVQDCMAGSVTNGMSALVWTKGEVPSIVWDGVIADYADTPQAIPYEAEARWAAYSNYKTADGLAACANPRVKMWEEYPPIPSTKQWLIKQGYIR